jgi:hypothetical protein
MLIKAAHDHRTKILQHPRTKTSITLPDSVQFHRQDHGREFVSNPGPMAQLDILYFIAQS